MCVLPTDVDSFTAMFSFGICLQGKTIKISDMYADDNVYKSTKVSGEAAPFVPSRCVHPVQTNHS